MQITKQLAIFLDNRPGMLARVCDALSEAGINIYAISTSDTVDHTVMRLVVSDYRKALRDVLDELLREEEQLERSRTEDALRRQRVLLMLIVVAGFPAAHTRSACSR